jgi:hypothetical protein
VMEMGVSRVRLTTLRMTGAVVNEEFADVAEFSIVMPEFSSTLYPILPLCVN